MLQSGKMRSGGRDLCGDSIAKFQEVRRHRSLENALIFPFHRIGEISNLPLNYPFRLLKTNPKNLTSHILFGVICDNLRFPAKPTYTPTPWCGSMYRTQLLTTQFRRKVHVHRRAIYAVLDDAALHLRWGSRWGIEE